MQSFSWGNNPCLCFTLRNGVRRLFKRWQIVFPSSPPREKEKLATAIVAADVKS